MRLILSGVICIVVGTVAWTYLQKSKSGLSLPPSPPTSSLLGHTLLPNDSFLTVAGWIHDYGPLVTIRSLFEKTIIIGRHSAMIDIMEKQSGSLADRPRMIAAGEILGGGLSVAFASSGDRFRRMRSALHTHLGARAAEAYQPLQMTYAKNTALKILQDPHNFQNHAKAYAVATVTKMAYGKHASMSATEIKEIRKFLKSNRVAARPGTYLVDSIPWLKYVPWYSQQLKREFEARKQIYVDDLGRVEEQLQSNADIGPSFARYMLENEDVHGLTKSEMACLAGDFFAAGVDTAPDSYGDICTVLMAAARFPEEQAKVQAELDAVIGRHRAPTFADEKSLPRLYAFISEALRWRSMAPHGHLTGRLKRSFGQENYRIPAGTTVLGHHWSISRDPEVYPEPEEFRSERWIDELGRPRDDLKNKYFTFGFGRRICPAQHVASSSIFINSTLVLWAFWLTLDPTKPLHDMGFMSGMSPNEEPCTIEVKTRISETELRRIMAIYLEVA